MDVQLLRFLKRFTAMLYFIVGILIGMLLIEEGISMYDEHVFASTMPSYVFLDMSQDEIDMVNLTYIVPLKEHYLVGVRKITFQKTPVKNTGDPFKIFWGNYNRATRSVKIYLAPDAPTFHNKMTMCHELLHHFGIGHNEVMDELSGELVCYRG